MMQNVIPDTLPALVAANIITRQEAREALGFEPKPTEKKHKPQVGDVIKTRAELASLPADSVALNDAGKPLIISAVGSFGYYGRFSPFSTPGNPPYRIVHIPE